MAMTRKSVSSCTQRFLSVIGGMGTAVSAYWGWDFVCSITKWAVPDATASMDPIDAYLKIGQVFVSVVSLGIGYHVTSKGIATSIGQHDELGDSVELLMKQNEELLELLHTQSHRNRAAETQIDNLTTFSENAKTALQINTLLHEQSEIKISSKDKEKLQDIGRKLEDVSEQNNRWLKLRHKRKRHYEAIVNMSKSRRTLITPPEVKIDIKIDYPQVKDKRSISALSAVGKFKREVRKISAPTFTHPLLKSING